VIAWTQKYIINKWFFLILLTVVIVAFVLTITPAGSGLTQTGEDIRKRDFFGINLASRKDVGPVIASATASAWINTGERGFIESSSGDLLLGRVAYLHYAHKLGLPPPSKVELERYIRSKRIFLGEDGFFSKQAYDDFKQLIDDDPAITQELMMQALLEDFQIDKISSALVGPGFALPFETQKQVEHSKTVWSIDVATLKYEPFQPKVEIDEEKLSSYYKSNLARFEESAKVKVSLIKFDYDRYAGTAQPTADELREFYEEHKDQFKELRSSSEAGSEPDPEPLTFESVKDSVTKVMVEERARRLAEEAAHAFILKLYERKISRDSKQQITGLLEDAGITPIELPAYTRSNPPEDTDLPRRSLEEAFALSNTRYYSDVIETNNAAAVLLLRSIEEARIPSFNEIYAKVEAEYRAKEKKKLFAEIGLKLKTRLEAALAEGNPFRKSAEAVGLEVETFNDFTRRNPPSELDRRLFIQNSHLGKGQISPMVILDKDGKFVHILGKEIPEEESSLSELADQEEILQRINLYYQTTNLIAEIVAREQQKSEE
tara:strand:+ start:3273 stop:4913 length:1641 start_codon:yes stop_codon:yes gene_type:complete